MAYCAAVKRSASRSFGDLSSLADPSSAMSTSGLLDVKKQFTFYGAYHTHPVNILIHVICVPIILWTFQVLASAIPLPSFIPHLHYQLNEYLAFDLNWPAIHAALYLIYYYALESTAALLYTPQMVLSLLTATAFSQRSDAFTKAWLLHGLSWVAQFVGHGFAEGRAPALLDNLIGAVVLAPFFVHMEVLFKLGYKPELHKALNNSIGVEIAKIRKAEGDKRRAADKKGF
ncbi:DUF962-domain-containing protein [Obba rivulosa]|uniref:DUF962-domain-containing protein n=1 Tax=Obba rivulosa TaxID=1052685 RepID=A0A8E2DUB8_9APHY|nr:DUF962-domain-containing protein [Obba rivulosa]